MVASPVPAAVTRDPGPAEVHDILRRHLITDGLDLVLDLEESHGAWMRCARTGRDFLDCFSYFATNPIGHNHPGVRDPAFVERLGRVAVHNPSNSDFYTVEMARFVDTFSRLAIPESLPHAFFIAGGAVAVGNALKTAFDWKVRKNLASGKGERGSQIIHFRQAFHGRSGYTLSLTNTEPMKVAYFPRFDWPRIENPYIRFPEAEHLAETEAAEARAIAAIEAAVAAHPDDIAGLIIEPIQGEGGDLHFRREFFEALRRLADEHEFLLIFDEVQTGVGMTGRMWCHQHFGVEPDVLVFGKKTQVCGILASRRVDEVQDNVFQLPSRINSTFGGNLVDMVRFGRYLEIIEEEDLVGNAARVGRVILDGLHDLARECRRPDDLRPRAGADVRVRPSGHRGAGRVPRPRLREPAADPGLRPPLGAGAAEPVAHRRGSGDRSLADRALAGLRPIRRCWRGGVRSRPVAAGWPT